LAATDNKDAQVPTPDGGAPANDDSPSTIESDPRFEALVRDRDSLRLEVTEMRRSLEEIQSKHQEEMGALRHKLEETEEEKEHAETQYRNLLGKVNTIKSQLGERLKADAVCALFSGRYLCFSVVDGKLTKCLGGAGAS
jgi:hypothetical protein